MRQGLMLHPRLVWNSLCKLVSHLSLSLVLKGEQFEKLFKIQIAVLGGSQSPWRRASGVRNNLADAVNPHLV